MAKIYRQIGSLSELLGKLEEKGIHSMNSLEDIRSFRNNFENNLDQIKRRKKIELFDNIAELKRKFEQLSVDYEKLLKERGECLIREQDEIELWLSEYNEKSKNLIFKIVYFYKYLKSSNRLKVLTNKFENERNKPFTKIFSNISEIRLEITDKENRPDYWVNEMSKLEVEQKEKIRSILKENKEFYYGAVGEQQALDELKKLPDSYVVINDYRNAFYNPIHDKRNDDRIYSIQVDHIVIGPTGMFIIETKNWSLESINSWDLFSPVKQLMRSNYALFVTLNKEAESGGLHSFSQHNWGAQQISPKNIVLMMKEKPYQEFQHVKVLSLSEVREYITNYKEKVFSKGQIEEMAEYLNTTSGSKTSRFVRY
jgi:hypothetical protein